MSHPNIDTLNDLAQECVDVWMAKLANTDFKKTTRPSITLNQRGSIAGAAVLQKNHIKLQAKLFEQNQTTFTQEVIPHELAHLVVFQHYGKVKPHGMQWQYVMKNVFGIEPKVRHSLDVRAAGVKMFDYECACDTVQLSAIRHNRVLRGEQRYYCKRCKQALVESIV